MTATPALTEDLKKQVVALEDDLRRRVDEDPGTARGVAAGVTARRPRRSARPGPGSSGATTGSTRPRSPGC